MGADNATNKILVSGCINGRPIRYNATGVDFESDIWDRWEAEGRLIRFCPELGAGMAVPRRPAETVGGDGAAVLAGNAKVLEDTGGDVTDTFVKGAELALARAVADGCVAAVLTDGSPSCGSTYIYDGTFGGGTYAGMGVTAQLLADNGIAIFSENRLELADEYVRSLEGQE
jgi:uncharacterized protein YbbK (DUF523 family)